MDDAPNPPAWAALFQILRKFESAKLAPWVALRNATGVVVPLGIGVALGQIPTALVAATGALNVSFSDSDDPYQQRAKRMLASSFVVGIAVFLGASFGRSHSAAVIMATLWAFAAGMLVALSTAAADIGVVSLVTLVVFSAQPMELERAAASGAFALAGGLLQTTLALALWPVRRYEPERRALGVFYAQLARIANTPIHSSQTPPATQESIHAHDALRNLSDDHSVLAERYVSLLNQAERIRLSIMTLRRLFARMERDGRDATPTQSLSLILESAAQLLDEIADSLMQSRPATAPPDCLPTLRTVSEELAGAETPSRFFGALVSDAQFHTDALAGQLRAALDLATNATPEGGRSFLARDARQPWGLKLQGTFATLRANFTFRSTAFRHAVRLAACIAIGDALGRALDWQRSYWAPMTIAIVLKPDFTSTFSRGVLRLVGTFAGLLLATGLFHLLPPQRSAEVLLIGVFMYIVRWAGPANYGIFVAAVTALVVLLFALTGIAPGEVIAARGWNTIAGGTISLLAYWLWPTWERHQVGETVALMLDSYRVYFKSVAQGYLTLTPPANLEGNRIASRLARSNLEAAVDRTKSEPGFAEDKARLLGAILASSHRLVHAVMTLEAGLYLSRVAPAREEFRTFSHQVELTLYYLASALRGSALRRGDLPDLRQAHTELTEAGDVSTERYALVNVETDRITNSLNTLSAQAYEWVGHKVAQRANSEDKI